MADFLDVGRRLANVSAGANLRQQNAVSGRRRFQAG
jgi:hypothetical protein